MKISAAPHRVDDLLRFLRSLGYEAEEVDYALVSVARGTVDGVLPLRLAREVTIWNAVNSGDAEIVELSGALEP